MSLAKNISGNRKPPGYTSNKQLLAKRDAGLEKGGGSPAQKRRISKKISAGVEFSRNRPVAQLSGYFTPQKETYCKTLSQEELDKLNKERGNPVKRKEDITDVTIAELFSFDELRAMARECMRRDVWINPKLKEYKLKLMTEEHIVNCICLIKRHGNEVCWGFGRKWLRKFAQEIEDRKNSETKGR